MKKDVMFLVSIFMACSLSYSMSVSDYTSYRDTPLHCAAKNGDLKQMCILIAQGGNMHQKNQQSETPRGIICHRAGELIEVLREYLREVTHEVERNNILNALDIWHT